MDLTRDEFAGVFLSNLIFSYNILGWYLLVMKCKLLTWFVMVSLEIGGAMLCFGYVKIRIREIVNQQFSMV